MEQIQQSHEQLAQTKLEKLMDRKDKLNCSVNITDGTNFSAKESPLKKQT